MERLGSARVGLDGDIVARRVGDVSGSIRSGFRTMGALIEGRTACPAPGGLAEKEPLIARGRIL